MPLPFGDARIGVIFARNEETFDEVVAGVAFDVHDAAQIAAVIERDNIACWTEFIQIVQTEPGAIVYPGQTVHLVLGDAPPQDSREMGWGPDFAPELLGAFEDHRLAARRVAELDDPKIRIPGRLVVWSVPIGWHDKRLEIKHPN
ncbi:hypothetical protein L5G28_00095 [Gordonia sp. HY285]|uniref:hypothetical protein n=1 Tax=Gordonia liuliyuniae TaxID=2911517 RepID=UPI001F1DA2BB|nr:hypothetical protein [Gordonia liuliyuniae]MCF8608569.1 hypothetical protein [Gordonia liuliyuniae]